MNTHTIELLTDIVRAQGVVFVRELLRSAKNRDARVRIGIKKLEVLSNLRHAVSLEAITLDDVHAWLSEVEGWGKQHLYPHTCRKNLWRNSTDFSQALREARIKKLTAKSVLEFPDTLKLAGGRFNDGLVEVIWRRATSELTRDMSRDYSEAYEGDRYEFHAWREEKRRNLVRFVLDVETGRAAFASQIPLGDEHSASLAKAKTIIAKLIPKLDSLSVSDSVKGLDNADLRGASSELGAGQGTVRAKDTRFMSGGASVRFSAEAGLSNYNEVTAVRNVRRALKTDEFTGNSAKFEIDLRTGSGLNRTVTMNLYGQQKRAYLYSKMTAAEVLAVLDFIFDAAV